MPAQIKATAMSKRTTRGSIFKKNNTGSPLESRMSRIRNTPTPTPKIRSIILNQIGIELCHSVSTSSIIISTSRSSR